MSQAIAIAHHSWSNKGRLERICAIGVIALLGLQIASAAIPTPFAAILAALRDPLARDTLIQSMAAGLVTAVGALALPGLGRIDERRLGLLLGFAAGAMSMAALFALLLPALSASGFAPITLLAGLGGLALMALLDQALPHRHPGATANTGPATKTAILLTVAIALHNLPEGFAVAAAAGAGSGGGTAMAIALQNLPEGLIVAAALRGAGVRPIAAIGAAAATGLLEPLGALLGIAWVGASLATAPLAMAAAAGAMLFVIGHELIPASARRLAPPSQITSLTSGFATMAIAGSFF